MRKLLARLKPTTGRNAHPPAKSTAFTPAELALAMTRIRSEQELLELDRIIDLMAFDGDLDEAHAYSLYCLEARMISLFIHIDDHFPHDYYPPFAVENHILHADSPTALQAFALHLRVNEKRYIGQVGIDRLREYRHRLRQKSVTLETR